MNLHYLVKFNNFNPLNYQEKTQNWKTIQIPKLSFPLKPF